MTALAHTGTAGFLSRYDALRDRLPGDPRQRDLAAEAFRRAGLPGAVAGRREEAWKYTGLRAVADASFQQSVSHLIDEPRLPRIAAPRLVFVDGAFSETLSVLPTAVKFSRFADRGEFLLAPSRGDRGWDQGQLGEDQGRCQQRQQACRVNADQEGPAVALEPEPLCGTLVELVAVDDACGRDEPDAVPGQPQPQAEVWFGLLKMNWACNLSAL